MAQVYNPYLPLTEYVPDGEPHVFGDRIYVYGSHDIPGGTTYCQDHYTVWSAPVSDLSDWRCHGVTYRRNQDPSNARDTLQLWAPDVTQGPDGRYYLYYCFSFYPEIGVAVSDDPAGPFEFYGHVHYPETILGGKTLQEHMVFDPAVLTDDDGRIFLYYGFAPGGEKQMKIPDIGDDDLPYLPPAMRDRIRLLRQITFGENSMVIELEPDMLTVKEEPRVLIPGENHSAGTSFAGHGFFEASSIRKFNGRYYFVYSSHKSHELCYAVSDYPDRDFVFGGTLISNGDMGLRGRTMPDYPLGNTHGGIEKIGDDFYVFYHRQTNATEFSRQGCAEKIFFDENGHIPQAEKTSCGLNGGPLKASGIYPAGIACVLRDPTVINRINYNDPILNTQIRITQSHNTSFITDIKDHSVIGYRYFRFAGNTTLLLELNGHFTGTLKITHDENGIEAIGGTEICIQDEDWRLYAYPVTPVPGTEALYLHFTGDGTLQMRTFGFLE